MSRTARQIAEELIAKEAAFASLQWKSKTLDFKEGALLNIVESFAQGVGWMQSFARSGFSEDDVNFIEQITAERNPQTPEEAGALRSARLIRELCHKALQAMREQLGLAPQEEQTATPPEEKPIGRYDKYLTSAYWLEQLPEIQKCTGPGRPPALSRTLAAEILADVAGCGNKELVLKAVLSPDTIRRIKAMVAVDESNADQQDEQRLIVPFYRAFFELLDQASAIAELIKDDARRAVLLGHEQKTVRTRERKTKRQCLSKEGQVIELVDSETVTDTTVRQVPPDVWD